MQRAAIMMLTLITAGSSFVPRSATPVYPSQHHPAALAVGVRAKAISRTPQFYVTPGYKFFGRPGQNTTALTCGHGDFRDGYRLPADHTCGGS